MVWILLIMILISFAASFLIYVSLYMEKKRNRILQSFVAGIIRSICAYSNQLDSIDGLSSQDFKEMFERKFPIDYSKFLENVDREFCRDFWISPYFRWIKDDRNLFTNESLNNGGFSMIYWDFHDRAIQQFNEANKKEEGEAEAQDS